MESRRINLAFELDIQTKQFDFKVDQVKLGVGSDEIEQWCVAREQQFDFEHQYLLELPYLEELASSAAEACQILAT